MNEGKFYYRRAVDTKSVGFIVPFLLICFLFRWLGEMYQDNFPLENCLVLFAIANTLIVLSHVLIQKFDRAQLYPYFPTHNELVENLDKVHSNLRALIIAAVACAMLVLALSYVYLKTGEFAALLVECAFLLFLLSFVFTNGLVLKPKLIKMIENREIP